jgi:hypothetical protein
MMRTARLRIGLSLTILLAKLKMIAAWSRDCAAEYSSEFGRFRAGGPHRCASNRHAASVVLAFFLPRLIIARLVPAGLS